MIKRILIVLAIIFTIVLFGIWESTYTREAIVTNSNNGIVTVEDNCGFQWEYKGTATIGDNVTLIMSDNYTSKITDDIIKGVE